MPAPLQTVQVFAPAKVNLSLHVTGRRADGYHLLDSLVAFADVGDMLTVTLDKNSSLDVNGPEWRGVPSGSDNLVAQVATLFSNLPGAHLELTKNLPAASGIGGGSADAAAAFRGLSALQHGVGFSQSTLDVDEADCGPALLRLGADIPMCVASVSARVQGIGEHITRITTLPTLDVVLVNPRKTVSTQKVFKALKRRDNAPMQAVIPEFDSPAELAGWLSEQRNDLEAPATEIELEIAVVKTALSAQDKCVLTRMSGSGATCFGIFSDQKSANEAAAEIANKNPTWWVHPARLGSQTRRGMPVFK